MSVQLIVYPQSFDGTFNSMFSSPTELLVNGINFNGLNNTSAYTGGVNSYVLEALVSAPANVPNTWYRFVNTVTSGSPAMPIENLNNLVLNSITTSNPNYYSRAGVYQKLTNLTIGATYNVKLNFTPYTNGIIICQNFNSNFQFNTPTLYITGNSGDTNHTFTFTAISTSDILTLTYLNNGANTITIQNISVQPVNNPINSGAIQLLGNGQVICDLYEDEDIPLSLSVDDFKNVAEKVQSYSKAFNLPATKRNNKIFNQIFDITRSADGIIFNPYKKTECVLKQDGIILFKGYLRMLDVTDKEGEISYNVNLYSEVLALADLLKDRTFRDLDFTELEHAYNKTNIKRSWNDSPDPSLAYINPSTSGFRDAYNTLRYPFVDWNHQIPISNGTNGILGFPELITLEQAFRPFINIKYIIDRIFEATDFTYESSFFNEADFLKLYMDFNWGSNDSSSEPTSTGNTTNTVISTTSYVNYKLNNPNTFSSDLGYDDINDRFLAPTSTQYNLQIYLKFLSYNSSETLTIRIAHRDNSGNLIQSYSVNNFTGLNLPIYNVSQNVFLSQNDTLQVEFKSSVASTYTQLASSDNIIIANTGQGLATTDSLLQNLRGELGQWEFLKGLFTMFNLVSLPDETNPNNIKIEPYADVFITPGLTTTPLNWTEKIDVSQMKLTPLIDLNRNTIFKFVEDDDDFAFNNYKNLVGGHLYGSQKFEATNEFNILDGEEEIVAEPFAATVVKPLDDNYPQFITPAIYAMNDDGTSEGFENSPRIMYNNGKKSTGVSFYIPPQNGLSSENQTNFLQFSHLSSIPSNSSSLDFHFGICQLFPGLGVPTTQNLFNLYWLPYLGELYNPNTRTMTIKVNLTPADINTFKFNDTVFIKNRVFRVNKIDYKPNDLATVEFILIP